MAWYTGRKKWAESEK
ncbi:Protein CBG27850 [Caenorhabditis briggsae]|uniref:Protein CBG27850 n=1 Tax=Caenorhabditis briggsae TaxID=6238 RepID=B6IKD2_CAEBR|nr:Protein CBG27850 [Caenorhabditis briggsae]CAS00362.1 Protein CBG27850 [Caenorhabditis briggsae]